MWASFTGEGQYFNTHHTCTDHRRQAGGGVYSSSRMAWSWWKDHRVWHDLLPSLETDRVKSRVKGWWWVTHITHGRRGYMSGHYLRRSLATEGGRWGGGRGLKKRWNYLRRLLLFPAANCTDLRVKVDPGFKVCHHTSLFLRSSKR